jgi:hypothetical protein
MPILWALANPKISGREALEAMLHRDAHLIASRKGIVLTTDKGFAGRDLERLLAERGVDLLRPARKKEKQRWGATILKKIRRPVSRPLIPYDH